MRPSYAFAANARFGAGGQGEFLRQMAGALAGREAVVFSRHCPGPDPRPVDVRFSGGRKLAFDALLRLPLLSARHDWLSLLSDAQFDRAVAQSPAIGQAPPLLFDGVMAQCADTFQALAGTGTRRVLTSLNTHIDHLSRELAAEHERLNFRGVSFVHPRMIARARREIASADHIRVNSEFARQTFVDHGADPSRVTAIHPAVDLQHFRDTPEQDDVFRVLAVSSVDPRKGIHDLLEAFEAAKIPRSELVLIGGTGDRWSKALVAGYRRRNANIRMEHADVSALPVERTYGRASVFVHPAIEDGFGLVVAQALAAGRPVIVSAGAGASELVRDGENGFVVPPRSPGAIRQELRLLATDADLRRAMAARARQSVEHLTQARFTAAVHALYTTVLT